MPIVTGHVPLRCSLLVGLVLLLLTGCNPAAELDSTGTQGEAEGETSHASLDVASDGSPAASAESSSVTSSLEGARPSESEQESSSVSVAAIVLDDLPAKIADHSGNVVMIDYWATWCGPCLQEFPHTIELSQKYAEAGLRVMTISCDDPSEGPKVLSTLKKLKATTENYHTSVDMNQTFEGFDIRGGIPFYQLYDRKGNLRYRFNGAPTPQDEAEATELLEMRIRELLEE